MIPLLKNLLKEILVEGPEFFKSKDLDWKYDAVISFIIYRDDRGKIRYAYSNTNGDVFTDDGNEVPSRDTGGMTKTHGAISDAIFKLYDYSLNMDYESEIHGRIWDFGNHKYCVSTWNDVDQLKSFGMDNFLKSLLPILKTIHVHNVNDVYYNPLQEKPNEDEFYTLDQLKSSTGTVDPKAQELQRQIHMMDPQVKAQFLKRAGVQPKVGDIPDFIKKQQLGIDEEL